MEIGELPLAQARTGMVLSGELRDAQGQLLLPRGTVLTQAMLASLARHGIETLPLRAVVHAASRERVDYLFRKLDPAGADAWAGAELRACLYAWRAGATR